MAEEPDRLRNEIEQTRAELARDVDRLADKTSPARVVERRWDAVKEKVRNVSDRVMGSADDEGAYPYTTTGSTSGSGLRGAASSAASTAGDAASTAGDKLRSAADTAQGAAQQAGDKAKQVAGDVADNVRQTPAKVARQTRGNPLAAGIIAFGAGLLVASLLPETETEKRAARQVKEKAGDLVEPIREPLMESAQQLRDDVGSTVRDAAQQVKETAKDAAQTTKEQAKSSAQDAADQTKQAAQSATGSGDQQRGY
jgi:gas vesicle protein